MFTAERQRAQPYLDKITGPVYEQWDLLHHRMIRIVTNHAGLAGHVRHFLYYAELQAEYTYEQPSQLPVEIPVDLLWQVGDQLYKPVALTCFLFAMQPGEAFPPSSAEEKPDDVIWEEITGVDGPLRGRWKRGSQRFREYQSYPGVSSRIVSVMDKVDLYATIYIEDMDRCAPWFVMRFVFYMVIGAMFGTDGFEIIHAAALAEKRTDTDGNSDNAGILFIGSPGSGKSTLVLSCLKAGMSHLADDVLFMAKDDDVVHVYAFPEDIGVRPGAFDVLGEYEFMQTLLDDNRQKRYVDIQQHFAGQFVGSCPVRLMIFLHAENRGPKFRFERMAPTMAVTWLMQEYISHQRAQEGEADYMFDIFSDVAAQAPAYKVVLTPDPVENARQVRALLYKHLEPTA